MVTSQLKRTAVVIACLALSACTETIIKEVASTNGSNSGSGTGQIVDGLSVASGANMVPVNSSTTGGGTTTSTSGSNTGGSSNLLQDPASQVTSGAPGMTVDCKQTVPCQWVSADDQFVLTVTNADNIATRSRLSVSYSITTSHDTELVVARADDAIDAAGFKFKVNDQSLGGGNGGTPQGVTAGIALTGTLNYDKGSSSSEIADWSVAILDGGLLRIPTFTGIPIGTITTAQADCQFTLPCIWTTPQNDVAITLQSVGGVSTNSRLNVNFSVEVSTARTIAVDTGAVAVGSDGTRFESRTHTIGFETDYAKTTKSTSAGIPLYGSVNFYRTEQVPETLQVLSLVVYQDDPVPRWNPQFINVPVQ